MKSVALFFVFVVVCIVTNIGCKTSPTSAPQTGTGIPTVTIIPDSLHGVEFVNYTFKAKISNFDLAQTYFLWDMGDGSQVYLQSESFKKTYAYSKPGTFTITVKAYDIYTDSVVASKSENIIIDTVHTSVEIVPQFYIGYLKMDAFGKLLENFSFSVKLSNPALPMQYKWDFGDGLTDSNYSPNFSHRYIQPGVYLVTLKTFQANGISEATDTALISINYDNVTLASLGQMGRVQAILYLDSSYQLFHVGGYRNPLALGLFFSNSGGYSSSWAGGNFSTQFHSEMGAGTPNYVLTNYGVSGSVSADMKTINSIKVYFEDTSSVGTVRSMYEYGFKADKAELLSSTADQAMFRVLTGDLKNVLHDVTFNNFKKDTSDCPGAFPGYVQTVNLKISAQLLIVFTKQ